jgi:serine/threonine protein kinase
MNAMSFAREPSALLPRGTILGAFEITGFVASGGMGSVYKAKNRLTGQVRALKVILPAYSRRPEFMARFVREIQIAASLEHPNVVRVFEPGIDGDRVFLPMELLEGETLSELLRHGRLSPHGALDIVLPVGRAVALFHAQGVLHRDLKPSNIFLARRPDGQVIPKVLDFGAAKPVDMTEETTATGLVIGSPHYMSIEQASGAKDLDARADQYALGVILYQAITGVRPFENDDTGHALAKVLAGAPFRRPREIVPDLPAELEAVVLRAMSRQRNDRYPKLKDFLDALKAAVGDEEDLDLVDDDDPSPSEHTRFAPLVTPSLEPPQAMPAVEAAPQPGVTTHTVQVVRVGSSAGSSKSSKVWGLLGVAGLVALSFLVGWRLFKSRSAPEAEADSFATAPARAAATAAALPSATAEPPVPSPSSMEVDDLPPSPEPSAAPAADKADTPSDAVDAATPEVTPEPKRAKPARSAPKATVPDCVPRPGSPCM